MKISSNPGRTAGLWYLALVLIGPLRLIYIPGKLFVHDDATATMSNIAAHETLFRAGMAADLVGGIVLVLMAMALYRLFAGVDRGLAVSVVIFGGVMPGLLYFVGVACDFGVLTVISEPSYLVAAFGKVQRDALAMMVLAFRNRLNTGAEMLWGVWLFPLAALVWRSRFVPRFLGVWLALAGAGWVALCLTGTLWPQHLDLVDRITQPVTAGEVAFTLWLLVKGAKPEAVAMGKGLIREL